MGGGVMRTALVAAAWAAYRPSLGRATSGAGLKSTVRAPPPSASATVVDSAPISIHLEESKGLNESANRGISEWELDDWQLKDLFEEPPPRLVFGSVASLEEAQEATGDLTRALQMANEHGKMSLFQNNAIIPAMPRGVSQAFSLLQSSPKAQSVVASLAADPNVWDAVLKNEKVMEFCRNQSRFSEIILEESLQTNQNKSEETHSEAGEAPHGSNGFFKFVNNVKVKAMEVVINISNLIQDFLSKQNLNQDLYGTKDGADSSEAGSTFQSFITPNTFYVLAIAVISIVLLKRV